MNSLIDFRHICKSYGRGVVLDDVSVLIYPRHCSLLVGENGSGKTTLLKILAGLLPPDDGQVAYEGRRLSWNKARKHYQKKVVYLHQRPYLFDATVNQNLAYGLFRMNRDKRRVLMDQAKDKFDLYEVLDRHARDLAGGEQQRVALARAWIRKPDVFLLDEPTANLDEASRTRLLTLLCDLKSEGASIMIASHESNDITSLCDSVLALDNHQLRKR